MKITEENTPSEPKSEPYHRKRHIVEQPHNTSYRFIPQSPGELERQAIQMNIQTEKDRLHQKSVREIIASAAEAAAAEEAAAIAEAKAKADAAAEKAARKRDKST